MDLLKTIVGGSVGGLVTLLGGLLLWKLNAIHTMRMAVVEQRFRAHQEAYALLPEVFMALYADDDAERHKVAGNLQQWWANNNLYLDEEPRKAVDALFEAFAMSMLGSGYESLPSEQRPELISKMAAASKSLEKAVALPPLADPTRLMRR